MRFIELFAGIGGFRYGLCNIRPTELADSERPKELNSPTNQLQQRKHVAYTCVWANEIDKYACQIYRKNFGGGELYEGDIRTVRPEDIPKAELLVGGFPCQAFSIAGKRKGFEDTRGTLFYEIARLARANRYKTLLLENVYGLLSHEGGDTFATILRVLDEMGYDVEWQVLNSKDFGVPQNRERVFIVGHLRGTSRPQVFPIGTYSQKDNSMANESKENGNRTWGGSLRARGTTSYGSGDVFIKNETTIRRLTPTECERLQGFPDGWTEGVSDTQRYKCLGNAVTTNVITEIGKRLTPHKE
jgi:DNA (cytosine-5)-methyltransferase 1